jgi:predicted kinase
VEVPPSLIVIGGFPGAGKSTLAERLSKELRVARLCSDVLGGSIRGTLGGAVPSSEAFRAGYDLLFRLTDEFLGDGCTVLVDCNMGWEFQWRNLDQVHARHPEVTWCPLVLRCPLDVCRERLRRRHLADPGRHPPVEEFFDRNPQLSALWAFLDALDRPDVVYLDGSQSPAAVFADALKRIPATRRP